MKTRLVLFLILFTLIFVGCASTPQEISPTGTPAQSTSGTELTWTEISFEDLLPDDLNVDMYQCWNGMGMDDQGRTYIGFTSFRDNRRNEDFVLFRYDPKTGEREFLGTFMDIAAEQENLRGREVVFVGAILHTFNIVKAGSDSCTGDV